MVRLGDHDAFISFSIYSSSNHGVNIDPALKATQMQNQNLSIYSDVNLTKTTTIERCGSFFNVQMINLSLTFNRVVPVQGAPMYFFSTTYKCCEAAVCVTLLRHMPRVLIFDGPCFQCFNDRNKTLTNIS